MVVKYQRRVYQGDPSQTCIATLSSLSYQLYFFPSVRKSPSYLPALLFSLCCLPYLPLSPAFLPAFLSPLCHIFILCTTFLNCFPFHSLPPFLKSYYAPCLLLIFLRLLFEYLSFFCLLSIYLFNFFLPNCYLSVHHLFFYFSLFSFVTQFPNLSFLFLLSIYFYFFLPNCLLFVSVTPVYDLSLLS